MFYKTQFLKTSKKTKLICSFSFDNKNYYIIVRKKKGDFWGVCELTPKFNQQHNNHPYTKITIRRFLIIMYGYCAIANICYNFMMPRSAVFANILFWKSIPEICSSENLIQKSAPTFFIMFLWSTWKDIWVLKTNSKPKVLYAQYIIHGWIKFDHT